MNKIILISFALLATFIAESTSQHIIRPTYRPPPGGPVFTRPLYRPPPGGRPVIIRPTYRPPPRQVHIRTVREVRNDEPLWLYKGVDVPGAPTSGDHAVLPSIIDDIKLDPDRRTARSLSTSSAGRGPKNIGHGSNRNTGPTPTHPGFNRRHARSVDSPSARRHGGHSPSSGSRNTGPTHPGYNRRNARSIRPPTPYDPFRPSPTIPRPYNPFHPRPGLPTSRPFPIYARIARDIQIPGVKKPTHRDVIIPNWNPNARVNPWQRLGVRPRRIRSIENEDWEWHTQDISDD